jgi:hypothetical protein
MFPSYGFKLLRFTKFASFSSVLPFKVITHKYGFPYASSLIESYFVLHKIIYTANSGIH